jgi:hypothetical protein
MVLSIGVFFSLIIVGLSQSLPHTLSTGLTAQGVPPGDAARLAALPPVGVLFASLLGFNPVQMLLGPNVLHQLPADKASYLTGRSFFPSLISGPFAQGLHVAFWFAIACCLLAAAASWPKSPRPADARVELAVPPYETVPEEPEEVEAAMDDRPGTAWRPTEHEPAFDRP